MLSLVLFECFFIPASLFFFLYFKNHENTWPCDSQIIIT